MNIIKKTYKKILLFVVACYIVNIFVSQQKTLNTYHSEIDSYKEKIAIAEDTKQSLIEMKENVNSPEYIEQIAREKLGMYLPNERVYIDISK